MSAIAAIPKVFVSIVFILLLCGLLSATRSYAVQQSLCHCNGYFRKSLYYSMLKLRHLDLRTLPGLRCVIPADGLVIRKVADQRPKTIVSHYSYSIGVSDFTNKCDCKTRRHIQPQGRFKARKRCAGRLKSGRNLHALQTLCAVRLCEAEGSDQRPWLNGVNPSHDSNPPALNLIPQRPAAGDHDDQEYSREYPQGDIDRLGHCRNIEAPSI